MLFSAQAQAILALFMTAALALPGITLVSSSYTYALINDILYMTDDSAGFNVALGSRLIPATTYRNSPQTVRKVYKELLDVGALNILGHLVAGGQVAANAHISSAVNPAWRTAKTHVSLPMNVPRVKCFGILEHEILSDYLFVGMELFKMYFFD
ncbi:hypothetical protein B0H13DRAFT_2509506 [Mycena leptocephala]|nr:hypothetical protein B0H13DRAFT_2509506 [Mycena leptocephala]